MPPYVETVISKTIRPSDHSQNVPNMRIPWKMGLPKSFITQAKDLNLTLTRYWRRYGVKASFFYTFMLLWTGFKNIIVDQDPNSTSEHFSTLQTFWLAVYRIVSLFLVNFTLPGIVSLLLYTLDGNDDIEDEEHKILESSGRNPLKLILRIVTRGDLAQLVKDSLNYHENLFKSHWKHSQDEIEFHVVTENPLNVARPKRNGTLHRCQVKEFHIPRDYETPNKSLYKSRNNTFALDRCLEEARIGREPLDRIWVIAIDEDVFLTRRWLQEFDDTVLTTKTYGEYKFVNSPSRPIFLDQSMGMKANSHFPPIVPFFGETFRFAMDVSRVWWQAKLLGRSSVGIRGSCYGIRLDVEGRIGYDYGGPFLSVGDDTTFVHKVMAEQDVKLKFLDAWFLEGAPNATLPFMAQRARWVRNYLYALLFAQVPPVKKLRLASFLIAWTIIMPCGVVCWGSGYVLMALNGRFVDFFPCGPAWPFLDAIASLSAACVIYWYIYGCALLLPWYWAVLVSLTFSTYIPVLPLHIIGSTAAVWGLVGGIHELITGHADFGLTVKKGV